MPTKLKKIVDRALSIREKAGFKTETITRKRYNMPYIPEAIKLAAKELKSSTPAPAKKTRDQAFKKAKDVKSENALGKLVRMSDGRVVTKKKFVEILVADGAVPGFDMVNKIKDLSRMQTFRADQYKQDEHDRKQKEAGKVPEYFLKQKNGVYSTVSKTEYDYALTLKKNRVRIVNTKKLSKRKVKYDIETLKKILKKIKTLPNGWAYNLRKGVYSYTIRVIRDMVLVQKTQVSGIYYSYKEAEVSINNEIVQEFISQYIKLIQ